MKLTDTITEEQLNNIKTTTDSLPESFDLIAKHKTIHALMSSYIDYLMEKNTPGTTINKELTNIANKIIERFDIGSVKFVNEVNDLVVSKLKKLDNEHKLHNTILKSFSTIPVTVTVPKIRSAYESFADKPVEETKLLDSYALSTYYFNKYGKAVLESCFPSEYKNTIL